MRPAPGVQVTSKIELVSPIAEGAMGSVWVAYHHRLKARVAVKFVSDRLGDDYVEALERFEREAALASQIKSPHIIQTYDSGLTPEGVPYMVMELLEGESLGDRLRRVGHIGLHDTAIVLTQIARALTKAHQHGIIHRDIKPDNIFLCSGEEGIFCKILDFGIAKQTRLPEMGGLTHEGKMVGTPEYLSPEQVLEGKPATYAADLWALGIVMYVSLTGYLPFTGKTIGQLCLSLASKKHTPPSTMRSTLPQSLDGWFKRALHRHQKRRFTSAREMALAFLAALPANESAGVDLGHGTLFSRTGSTEDTERSFGSSQDTDASLARRSTTPLLAATVAVGVLAIGGAGIVLGTAGPGNETVANDPAHGGIVDGVTKVASAAQDRAPSEVLDLDEDDPETAEPEADEPATKNQTATSWPPPDAERKTKPEVKPVAPPEPEPKPEPVEKPKPKPKAKPGRRGEDDLGF